MKLTLSCEQVIARLSASDRTTPDAAFGWRVSRHLSRCASCRDLRATLEAVPRIVRFATSPDSELVPAEARAALQHALSHLGEPRRHPIMPSSQLPPPLKQLLGKVVDEPLRLLALAHETLQSVVPRDTFPVLPEEVSSQLPSPETWKWVGQRGMRVAELCRDAQSGARLAIMFAPPGYRIPLHRHHGTESLLLLDGEMADELGEHKTGDLVHLEHGSRHLPVMGDEGCWCLVREVGSQEFEGPLGWLRNWLAA